jgi:hypothetical protein
MNAVAIAQKITSGSSCIVVLYRRLTPLRAIIRRSAYQVLRNSSGSLAILAAIRRAPSSPYIAQFYAVDHIGHRPVGVSLQGTPRFGGRHDQDQKASEGRHNMAKPRRDRQWSDHPQ